MVLDPSIPGVVRALNRPLERLKVITVQLAKAPGVHRLVYEVRGIELRGIQGIHGISSSAAIEPRSFCRSISNTPSRVSTATELRQAFAFYNARVAHIGPHLLSPLI